VPRFAHPHADCENGLSVRFVRVQAAQVQNFLLPCALTRLRVCGCVVRRHSKAVLIVSVKDLHDPVAVMNYFMGNMDEVTQI
jgi:hypothetical protein